MIMPMEERIIVEDMHEPLVDKETFNIVQDLIKSRTGVRTKSYDWLLKGLLTCKECGKKLSIVPQKHPNKTTFYVRCNTYACNTHLHLCTPHSNNLEKLTNYVIEQIKKRCNEFLDENKYMQVANSSKDKILKDRFNFKNEILVLEKKLKDIFSSFGVVLSTKIMRDPESGISKHYGFVSFDNFDSSDEAITKMNGQYLSGKPIEVEYAYKKDTKGEKHGSVAERILAANRPVSLLVG